MLIRPAAVTLARDPDGGATASGPAGTVVDTAYRGRGYDHVVELPGGVRLTGVFDRGPHPRGTRVHLLLDPDGCFAFADPRPDATEKTSAAKAAEPTPIRTTLEV